MARLVVECAEAPLAAVVAAISQTCLGHRAKEPKAGILCSLAKNLEDETSNRHQHGRSPLLQARRTTKIILSDRLQTSELRTKMQQGGGNQQARHLEVHKHNLQGT